jgi:hypothetical protein
VVKKRGLKMVSKTVLPTTGISMDHALRNIKELLHGEPNEGPRRDRFLRLLNHLTNMKGYCESLSKVIDYNKRRPIYDRWPKKIEVKNEYGTMFEMDFQVNPPLRSPYQKKADFFKYTSIYFDNELVLVEERGSIEIDRINKKEIRHDNIVIFNRLAPKIEAQMQAFFRGSN